MSIYKSHIEKRLLHLKRTDVGADEIEEVMRAMHGTLDGLSSEEFDTAVKVAVMVLDKIWAKIK